NLQDALVRRGELLALWSEPRLPLPLPSHSRKPAQTPPVSRSTALRLQLAPQIFLAALQPQQPEKEKLRATAQPRLVQLKPRALEMVELAVVLFAAARLAAVQIGLRAVAERPPFGAARSAECS